MSGSMQQRGIFQTPWGLVGGPETSRLSLSSDSGILSPTSSGYSTPDAQRSGQTSPGSDLVPRTAANSLAALTPLSFGPEGGLSQRVALVAQGGQKLISSWQDIPLFWPEGFLSCVNVTPDGTWMRYEVALDEPFHPLRPVRTGSAFKELWLRNHDGIVPQNKTIGQRGWDRVRAHVIRSFRPHHYADNTPWNIGVLPQTWGCTGKLGSAESISPDGLLKVFDIGSSKVRKVGEVYLIKPLGAFAVQEEEGELAWMVLGIAADDQMAGLLRDANDILALLPGLLEVMCEWMETCLGVHDGYSQKRQVVRGPYLMNVAMSKIRDYHKAWHLTQDNMQHEVNIPQVGLTAEIMEKVWSSYTVKDRKTMLGPIPVSNPESIIVFEESWFGPDQEDDGEEVESTPKEESPKAQDQAPAPAPVQTPVQAPVKAPALAKIPVNLPPPARPANPTPKILSEPSEKDISDSLALEAVAMQRYSSGAAASKPPPYAGWSSTTKQKKGFSKWWAQFRGKPVTPVRASPLPARTLA